MSKYFPCSDWADNNYQDEAELLRAMNTRNQERIQLRANDLEFEVSRVSYIRYGDEQEITFPDTSESRDTDRRRMAREDTESTVTPVTEHDGPAEVDNEDEQE